MQGSTAAEEYEWNPHKNRLLGLLKKISRNKKRIAVPMGWSIKRLCLKRLLVWTECKISIYINYLRRFHFNIFNMYIACPPWVDDPAWSVIRLGSRNEKSFNIDRLTRNQLQNIQFDKYGPPSPI